MIAANQAKPYKAGPLAGVLRLVGSVFTEVILGLASHRSDPPIPGSSLTCIESPTLRNEGCSAED